MVGPAGAEWLKGNLAMLVMSRKVLESIKFGDDITLTITRIRGNRVTVAIEAPKSVPVHRSEVYDKNKAKELQDGDQF